VQDCLDRQIPVRVKSHGGPYYPDSLSERSKIPAISHTRRQAELKIVIGSGFAHVSSRGLAIRFRLPVNDRYKEHDRQSTERPLCAERYDGAHRRGELVNIRGKKGVGMPHLLISSVRPGV
jgi:hypothetical protein